MTASTREMVVGHHPREEAPLNVMSGNTAVMAVPVLDLVQGPDQDQAPALAAEAETTSLKDLPRMGTEMSPLTSWGQTYGLRTQWTHMEVPVGTYNQKSWISAISTGNP